MINSRITVLLLAAFCMVSSVYAQSATWDGGAGDGNWTRAFNWVDDVVAAANDVLIFNGSTRLSNSNDFTAGTRFNGITFSEGAGAFTLGGNDLDLGGNVVNLSGNLQTVDLGLNLLQNTTFSADGGNITLNGAVSGSYGLVKDGGNILRLMNTNTFTGDMTVKSGLLYMEAGGQVDAAVSATLGGYDTTDIEARLRVDGVGGTTKTVNGVTLTPGRSRLQSQRSSGSGSFILDVGEITHETGAVLSFITSNSTIQTSSSNTNGILGGWATTWNGRNFVTVDGSGNLSAYSDYTDLSGAGTSQTLVSDATANVRITDNSDAISGLDTVELSTTVTIADTSGLTVGDIIVRAGGIPDGVSIVSIDSATEFTISSAATATATGVSGQMYDPVITMAAGGTTDVNTIIRHYGYSSDDVNTPRTLDIGAGNTLRLGEFGAVLRAEVDESSGHRYPTDTLTIANGVLTAGGADNSDGQIVFGTNGRHTHSSGNTSRNNVGIDVTSEIQDNGTGIVSVVIDSDQSTRFSGAAGANTYSGGTFINEGRLISTVTGNIGIGDVRVHSGGTNGGQLHLQGGGTYVNNMFLAGTGYSAGAPAALYLDNGSNVSGNITLMDTTSIQVDGSSVISSAIDGAGHELRIYGSGAGGTTSDVTLTNAASNLAGGVLLQNRAGQYTSSSPFHVRIGNDGLSFGDTRLVDSASSRKGQSSTFLHLQGYDLTVGGLSNAGSGRTYIQNSTAAAATATLTLGAGGSDGVLNGDYILRDGHASAVLNLVKTGAGTQELAGTNHQYTGSTVVNGGTLLVSGTLTGTSGVTANNGGTFAYTNAAGLNRDVTVNSGGRFTYDSDAAYTGALTMSGGTLSGSGNLGATVLSGTGSVDPGNSPGILSAGSFDPTGGLGANFEFTLANSAPIWSNASDSGNDVLRLTSGSTPFTASLDGANTIGIYLNLATLNQGDTFTGGFYTDLNTDFLNEVDGADFQYFVFGDGSGGHSYNGVDYYTLAEFNSGLVLSFGTVQIASADFADGVVTDGYASQITVVPEPSTLLLVALAFASLFALRRKK